MLVYEVTVCDCDPIYSEMLNQNLYRFKRERAAIRFMRQSLSQGHFVVMNLAEVRPWSEEEEK